MDFGTQTPFTGTKAERLALTDLPTHRARLFVETDTGKIYVCWDLVWHEIEATAHSHVVARCSDDSLMHTIATFSDDSHGFVKAKD